MITYFVSGAPDMAPSDQVLRRTGRRVRFGEDGSRGGAALLHRNRRYVVVAHGDESGTVYWSNGEGADDFPWLWVGMNPVPSGSRVYLYCCKAGTRLVRFLRGCECFGHSASVPAPVELAESIVLSYLDEVDRLMRRVEFGRAQWRSELLEFVAERMNREIEYPTSLLGVSFWLQLSRSLST